MLTSWKLWSALQRPPALHPLFKRTAVLEYQFKYSLPRLSLPYSEIILVILFFIIMVTYPQAMLILVLFVPLVMIGGLMGLPLLLPVIINLMGAAWASAVSASIAKEREKGTYDLLCLLPDGVLGANWAICSGCFHRGGSFEMLYMLVRAICSLGFIILGISIVVIVFSILMSEQLNYEKLLESLGTLSILLVSVTAYYIHYIQSIALSSLVGILIPFYYQRRFEAQIMASVLFLMAQVMTYTLTYIIVFNLLPDVYSDGTVFAYLAPPVVALGVFVFTREAVIAIMGYLLRQRLNMQRSELSLMVVPIP